MNAARTAPAADGPTGYARHLAKRATMFEAARFRQRPTTRWFCSVAAGQSDPRNEAGGLNKCAPLGTVNQAHSAAETRDGGVRQFVSEDFGLTLPEGEEPRAEFNDLSILSVTGDSRSQASIDSDRNFVDERRDSPKPRPGRGLLHKLAGRLAAEAIDEFRRKRHRERRSRARRSEAKLPSPHAAFLPRPHSIEIRALSPSIQRFVESPQSPTGK